MGDIAAYVSAGGAGMLAFGFAYLLVSNRQDRRHYEQAIRRDRLQYEQAIDRAEARADAAEQRAREERARTEEARRARYDAEDKLAAVLRRREAR